MKLRLLDDSIRMRLSRGEVLAAHEAGVVEGQTRFPSGSVFTFALEALKGSTEPSANYVSDRLVVRLPANEISAWASDDSAVTLTGTLSLSGGAVLDLLVEKDFECLVPREGEDQSGLFSNPDKRR